MLTFHPLTVADREAVQAVTLSAKRRNCNYSFANLVGWQFWFQTEVCQLGDVVVLRYSRGGRHAYMVCTSSMLSRQLIDMLLEDGGGECTVIGLEDSQVEALRMLNAGYNIDVEPCRNQYDYIYRREDLAALQGGLLKAKRNHVNRFRSNYPDFEYRPLTPELFGQCRQLAALWHDEKMVLGNENHNGSGNGSGNHEETIAAERRVMETVFTYWDELGMIGGAVFINDNGDGTCTPEGMLCPGKPGLRMVAFTYGSAVTNDTFDVCVEKADRHVDGAFAIINQQFAQHLPEQYIYLNREEDMGIAGLRKAKLSYHPEILLTYNAIHIT